MGTPNFKPPRKRPFTQKKKAPYIYMPSICLPRMTRATAIEEFVYTSIANIIAIHSMIQCLIM